MKKILSILLLSIVQTSFAQNFWQDNPYFNSDKKDGSVSQHFLTADGLLNYGCDGVHNEFVTKLYMGGYLDSAFVEKSTGSLLPVNRFGLTTNVGLNYMQHVNDTTGEYFVIGVQRRNSITGRFGDDAFRLAFQGNTRFKGEEADFSRTRFTSMSWSQFKFGYITMQSNSTISFSFSLLVGHRYNEANIEYGKLYTDSQGLSLTGSVAGDYWSSDTSNTSQYAMNGMGTSVDIQWTWFGLLPHGNYQAVKADLLDFGFMNWNNKTIHRYVDTTFEWNGVDVTPLFLDPDYVVELPDDSSFIKTDTTEFHRSLFLPAVARVTYMRAFFASRLKVKTSLAIPVWSEALPFGCITAGWDFSKIKTNVSGGVAYGGYSALQVPLKIEMYAIHQSCIEIGTTNALAFVNPATISGMGAYVKLSYCF